MKKAAFLFIFVSFYINAQQINAIIYQLKFQFVDDGWKAFAINDHEDSYFFFHKENQ